MHRVWGGNKNLSYDELQKLFVFGDISFNTILDMVYNCKDVKLFGKIVKHKKELRLLRDNKG